MRAMTALVLLIATTAQGKEYMNRENAPQIPSDVRKAAIRVSGETGMPAAILVAIASRESDFRQIIGDGGNSFGICQIHRRWHPEILEGDWRCPVRSFRLCAKILRDNLRHCGMDIDKAVAAYNAGPKRANEAGDRYTTGGDYSHDVFCRANAFLPQL